MLQLSVVIKKCSDCIEKYSFACWQNKIRFHICPSFVVVDYISLSNVASTGKQIYRQKIKFKIFLF